jgi:carbamoyl-phosphate synthase small subunit
MLLFTYPLVGNYGVGETLNQSGKVHVRGTIVGELMPSAGHRDAGSELDAFLRAAGVPGLAGVDTRFLTRRVRTQGVVPAALSVGAPHDLPSEDELREAASRLDYDATDFVKECSTCDVVWHAPSHPDGPRVALVDYGAKSGILGRLRERGAGVWLVPAAANAAEVLALQPDGVLLSNGPGDPARLNYAVGTVRGLIEEAHVPVFGICLGHQLMALAAGGRTSKMRFGHRGVNQPVLDLESGRVAVTTQNHGYMVDPNSVPPDFRVTHTNLNDGTVEGIAHVAKPFWGVQWHPEAYPGPTDTVGTIDRFLVATGR